MNNGWFKLYRKLFDKGMHQNHKLFAFWCWCLYKASFKPTVVIFGNQQINLNPGQFIITIKQAAVDCGLTVKELRGAIETLKKGEQISIHGTNKFSIVSVINWSIYQGLDGPQGQTKDAQKGKQNNETGRTKGKQVDYTYNRRIKEVCENKSPPTPTQPQKLKFAEQVFLTKAQHDDLLKRYGPEKAQGIIETYSNRKQAKGYTSSSDYHTILDWGVTAYEERNGGKANGAGNNEAASVYPAFGKFKTKDQGPHECNICRGYGVLEYEAETKTLSGKAITMSFYGYCPNCANWSAVKGDNDRAKEQQPVPAQYLATAKPFTETL